MTSKSEKCLVTCVLPSYILSGDFTANRINFSIGINAINIPPCFEFVKNSWRLTGSKKLLFYRIIKNQYTYPDFWKYYCFQRNG